MNDPRRYVDISETLLLSAWCLLQGRIYLDILAAFNCRFIEVCVTF